jgi:hypothetical protein
MWNLYLRNLKAEERRAVGELRRTREGDRGEYDRNT